MPCKIGATIEQLLSRMFTRLQVEDELAPYTSQMLCDTHVMELLDLHEAHSARRKQYDDSLLAAYTRLQSVCKEEDGSENVTSCVITYEADQEFYYLKAADKATKTCYVSSLDCEVRETVPKSNRWSVRPLREGASIVLKERGKDTRYFFIPVADSERRDDLARMRYREEDALHQIESEFLSYCKNTFSRREPLGLRQRTGKVLHD